MAISRTLSLLKKDIQEERFLHPRPYKPKKPLAYYISGECLDKRPIYAVHALARIAEHYLWKYTRADVKRNSELFRPVASFFYKAQAVASYTYGCHLHDPRTPDPDELCKRLWPVIDDLTWLWKHDAIKLKNVAKLKVDELS